MQPCRRLPCTLRRCLLLLLALWAWCFGFRVGVGRVEALTVLFPTPEDESRAMQAVELYTLAMRAVQAGDLDAGIAGYRASIDAYPYISGAYNNLAMLLFEQSGDGEQALALLERGLSEAEAVDNHEELVTIHNNIGYMLREAGGKHSIPHCVEAMKHFDVALEVDPAFVEALVNKASTLLALGEVNEAETVLLQVLQMSPDHASALIDLSRIHFERRDVDGAVELLDRIIHVNHEDHDMSAVLGAINNKAIFLREAGFTLDALRAQLQTLEIAPEDPRALSNAMTMQRVLCDWDGLEALEDQLVAVVTDRQLSDTTRGSNDAEYGVSLLPYDSTLVQLSDAFRRRIAQRYASSLEQPYRIDLPPSRWEVAASSPTRLRVGYLSFDFREHPMGHLTLALVETHDRQLVEVFCYSYGRDDASEWRSRFEQRCDVFRDFENATNLQAARQIASDEVDVLVDLMAHTKGARQGIPALEPSRVVVNYLGFPGTTGSITTHFTLVDKQVVPPEVAAKTMTERVVYLPTTYQANQYESEVPVCGACHHRLQTVDHNSNDAGDRGYDLDAFAQCVIDCQRTKRPQHGLPLDAVVFCNFNVNSKMDVRSFALWMNILRQVPGSVLWLLAPHRLKRESDDGDASSSIKPARLIEDEDDTRDAPDSDSARVKQALRAQAAALGVSPSRIVFAPRVDKRVHLARVALADVFLDSLVYNAHSTASDALWAHVPLVTTWGDSFPSRVAASLINNAVSFSGPGVSEIVAHSLKEYEHLAALLASDPAKRLRLRAEMAAQSLRCPLFDTERTTQGVERALEVMHDVKKLVSDAQLDDQAADELHELETRVEASPADFQAFMALVNWQLSRDRFEDVARMFEMHGHRFLWLNTSVADLSSSPPLQDIEKALLALTFSLNRIGRTADAAEVAERALARYDAFFSLGYNLGALYRAQGLFSRADEQQSAVAEAESRHAFAEWRDDASNAHKLERKRARRPKDATTIAFYCNEYSQSWWGRWGPSSAHSSGLGGSEEAVVFLSQELARLGYWVEVYGSPPPTDETPLDSSSSAAGDPRRVSWYHLASYDPDDSDVHVFVAWRYSVSLVVGKHARRAFFWAHDVLTEDTLSSALLATVAHRIVCVSSFQASFLPLNLRVKTVVLRNAVDDSFFTDGPNDDRTFVYGSAPNRGLAQLLLAWPLVRSRLPNATLSVLYGFTPQFEHWARRHPWPRVTSEPSTELTGYDEWRAAMHALLHETPGVTYVGLVDHSTLAEAYANSGFWLFPTSFSETSCISAMKAMANGAVPVTSRFEESALGETIGAFDQGPAVINATMLGDVEWWGTRWAERIAELVGSGDELRRLRAGMKRFARRSYRWSRVAREWHALITAELER